MDVPAKTLVLPPRLDQSTVPELLLGGAFSLAKAGEPITLDASAVTQCDGVGVAFIWTLQEHYRTNGIALTLLSPPEMLQRQLEAYTTACDVAAKDPEAQPLPPSKEDRITALGHNTCDLVSHTAQAITFVGEVLFRLPSVFTPRFRAADALLAFVRSGAEAVPVVTLIGFLLGLILAFQSAVPLQMFGAEGFVGGLVGIALVRELGLIITAILMAGRTASAFAAELGTMKVNEEIDALETMGIAPVRFLVLPRVVAGTLALPILSLFATTAGLLGGWLVMHILGFSASYFVDQLQSFVALKDLIGSLCKAFVFGFTVSVVGCWCGLRAGRDASAVGSATTSAVVSGIVLLAVLEGLFSVVFYAMGW